MSGGRFDHVVGIVFGEEGGKADDPSDHGGPTNMGITTATLREAIRRGLVRKDATIGNLTREEAKAIYFQMFWVEPRCYEFPAPLDLLAFDAFVQHRPGPAARLMQVTVGALPDGIIGPSTIRLAQVTELRGAIERYDRARKAFYGQIVEEDRTQGKFLHGWNNRLAFLKNVALEELAA